MYGINARCHQRWTLFKIGQSIPSLSDSPSLISGALNLICNMHQKYSDALHTPRAHDGLRHVINEAGDWSRV